MCLIALAIGQHPRYPLVIAANRDEYLQRPAAPLDWWQPAQAAAPVLGGRDLQAGGTWMALGANGRIAMLTNVRDPSRARTATPSRGGIVPDWISESVEPSAFWQDIAHRGHNPFNLLAGDLQASTWWWASDRSTPQNLDSGLYGLSNAALDTPWPKVRALKAALASALAAPTAAVDLERALFTALADRQVVADHELPKSGVGIERERRLAPAFIHAPEVGYGTRCSTLLVVERHTGKTSVRYVERQFNGDGKAVSQRAALLANWPLPQGDLPPVQDERLSPG